MKVILLFLTMFLPLSSSLACDCIMYPLEQYIEEVDNILTGTVVELLEEVDTLQYINTPKNQEYYSDRGYKVRVVVIEVLKTNELKMDTIEFTSGLTNCDPLYKLGESYLFFADKSNQGKFIMKRCTPWAEMETSQQKIIAIRESLK